MQDYHRSTFLQFFQEAALFYSLQSYNIANQYMIYECEYFGYNSLLTQHGTRIRRLRRTEVTAQKIACARTRSPQISSQKYITNGFMRENRSSQAQLNHNNSRSKLPFKYVTEQRLNFRREKEDSSRQEMSRANLNALESQNGSFYGAEAQSKRSIKDSVAQYYLNSSTAHNFQSKSKKGIRRLQSHDSTQSIRKAQMNNNFRPFQQSDQASKSSYLPYIPKCTNKKLLLNNKIEAATPEVQPIQTSLRSSVNEDVRISKKMSSINGSVVSRSSCMSRSGKDEKLSIQDNFKANNDESQVHNYSQMASDYGLDRGSAQNIKHLPQIAVFYSKNELKSSQKSFRSKQPNSKSSKIQASYKKLVQQLSQKSQEKCQSKRSNEVQTQNRNEKLQKCYLTKKSTSAEQSCKSNQAENNLVFEFNRNKEVVNKKAYEMMVMSDTKGLKNQNQKDYILTSEKEKKASKFNPQTKIDTFQNINTPQKKSNNSKISHQQLTSSIKSARQKQNYSSICSSQQSTITSLMRQIEQHQMRLGFIYLFIDNTQQTYKGALQFERYERLCFLMFKKYLFEMNRVVQALRGGPNCFKLTGIQIKPEALYNHINSSLFSEKINDCVDQAQQLYKKLEIQWHRISKKYNKDKLIRLQYTKDNFTKQIVKLLMQELTKLYQELQSEEMEHDQVEQTQKRITEIIQIMFLLSQLTGRKVKNFELLSQQTIDFKEYYALHYQKIIQTHQFFQKLNE